MLRSTKAIKYYMLYNYVSKTAAMVNSIYPDACPKLLIENGNAIMLSTDEVGAVAKYECHKDFKLEGDSIRRCLGNHKWTGKEPQCHRQCECSLISY